jgi:hypothetical protein
MHNKLGNMKMKSNDQTEVTTAILLTVGLRLCESRAAMAVGVLQCCTILGSAVSFLADTSRQNYRSCDAKRYLARHTPKSFSLP